MPPLPTPDDTEDAIRSDPDPSYSTERHRRRHERAVAAWRTAVCHDSVERTTVETPAGSHEVAIATLG